jgi:hypothetical protein
MQTIPQALIAKMESLPADRLAEVEDFIDFISAKTRRREALDRLLSVAPALETAGATPINEEEIQAEIDAARAGRRGAARS